MLGTNHFLLPVGFRGFFSRGVTWSSGRAEGGRFKALALWTVTEIEHGTLSPCGIFLRTTQVDHVGIAMSSRVGRAHESVFRQS